MLGCEKCDYKGYIRTDTYEVKSCSCAKRHDLARRMKEADIPKRMAKVKLEDWNIKQNVVGNDLSPSQIKTKESVYYILSKIYQDPNFPHEPSEINDSTVSSILFEGPADSGKTFCTTILCKKAVVNGALVKFYDWFDLTSGLDRFDNRSEIDALTYYFENCDLIAINGVVKTDLGTQAKNQLSRLFRKRINNELWTIVSSAEGVGNNLFPGWLDFCNNSLTVKLL
jgi:DNA replication protein DnaC